MEVKDFEGVEYLEKSQVDELIRSRLAKMSERARRAETTIDEMKGQLEKTAGASGQIEAMASQLEALQAELTMSDKKYQIHATITASGFTDPGIRDMIEWSYSRVMAGTAKKNRQPLAEWLETIKSDPAGAPAELRPHITPAPAAPPLLENPPAIPGAVPVAVARTPAPPSNGGVQPSPPPVSGRGLLDQALADPNMWKAKNEEIRAAWYHQQGKPGPFKF